MQNVDAENRNMRLSPGGSRALSDCISDFGRQEESIALEPGGTAARRSLINVDCTAGTRGPRRASD